MEIQVEKMLSNFGECVQYKEIVKSSLEELMSGSQESQEQAEKILDTENLFEAQQLLLHHQVESSFFPMCVHNADERWRIDSEVRGWGWGGRRGGRSDASKHLAILVSVLSDKHYIFQGTLVDKDLDSLVCKIITYLKWQMFQVSLLLQKIRTKTKGIICVFVCTYVCVYIDILIYVYIWLCACIYMHYVYI